MATGVTNSGSNRLSEEPVVPQVVLSETPDQIAASKANGIALEKFNEVFTKIKTTQTYGIVDSFYFRVILSIGKIFKKDLSKTTEENLKLYHRHQELTALVDRVKQAYAEYLPAAEAVEQASVDKIGAARLQKLNRAAVLIDRYQKLVRWTNSEADRITAAMYPLPEVAVARSDIARTALLQDVHETLSQGNDGAIFYTINMERAKAYLENGSPDTDELKKRYKDFALNFMTHVQQAVIDSGDEKNIDAIKQAFIAGLSMVPGLKNDFTILSILASLAPDRDGKRTQDQQARLNTEQQELENHFISKVNELINSENPVDKTALENIQHKGVALSLVINPADVGSLKKLQDALLELKELNENLQGHQDLIDQTKAEKLPHTQIIEQKTEYSVKKLVSYLRAALGSDDEFERFTFGEQIIMSDGVSINDLVLALVEVEKKIKGLESKSLEERAALEQEIQEAVRKANDSRADYEHYNNNSVSVPAAALSDIVRDVKNRRDRFNAELASLKDEFRETFRVGGTNQLNLELQPLEDEIKRKSDELVQNKAEAARRHQAAAEALARLDELQAEAKKVDSKGTREDLQSARAERDRLNATTIVLSGRHLLENLNFERPVEGLIGTHLKAVCEAKSASDKLQETITTLENEEKVISNNIREIEFQNSLTANPLFDATSKKLTLNADFFNEQMKATMKDYLESNLNIAMKLTQEVSQVIADRASGQLKQIHEQARATMPAELHETLGEAKSRFATQFASMNLASEAALQDVIGERFRVLPKLNKASVEFAPKTIKPLRIKILKNGTTEYSCMEEV